MSLFLYSLIENKFVYRNEILTFNLKSINPIQNILVCFDNTFVFLSFVFPLKVVTSENYRGSSGDPQGTKTKNENLVKKLFFRSNSSCITYLFLFFIGITNIQ